MKLLTFTITLFFYTFQSFAQSTDLISQLISAENYFSALAKEKGIRAAFLKVSDENTMLFRPGPVRAVDFFKSKSSADSGLLSWEPAFARISKSNDWGFTTGPYVYRPSKSSQSAFYGDYVSVWKKNDKGVWKLALDLGIPHGKPKSPPKLLFKSPKTDKFMHQHGTGRLQQREDIVYSTDKLYATILRAENNVAFSEFLSQDTRLLFPGLEPVIGKEAVTEFWQKQGARLASQPEKADRAYSGELAFTYGSATIRKIGESKNYHYVRIWEIQEGFNWNIILEIYTPEK
jgi:ketosteroid isomerase-like protein